MKVSVINVLFAIGIFSNLVKLGDLILRPSQQQIVQRAVDRLTLWLDYTRPLDWLRRLLTKNSGRTFIRFTTIFVIISNIGQILSGGGLFGILVFSAIPQHFHIGIKIFALTITVLLTPFIVNRYGVRIALWLVADGRLLWLLLRYVGCAILGAVGFGLLVALLGIPILLILLASGGDPDPNIVMAISFLVTLPLFEVMITILMVPGLAIISMYFLVPLDICLRLLRGLAWRVAEYSKGAWAALMLLATVFLGIATIILNSSKH